MNQWIQEKGKDLIAWARASALHYYVVRGVCCADEFTQTVGARYDLERFGAVPERDHRNADVLVVLGTIGRAASTELRAIYDEMSGPKWVMAVGTCACSGGLFATTGEALSGISDVIPVDVFVPGCPPRPEAIIDGWIELQNRIRSVSATPKAADFRRGRDEILEKDRRGLA